MKLLIKIILIVSIAICMSWVCRKFFYQYYVVPTPSMMSTISSGEGLIIRKCFHRSANSSSSFIARKEIIVFEHPRQAGLVLVKRCIGMPGDRFLLINNAVYINGSLDKEPREARFNYRVGWNTVVAYNFLVSHFNTRHEEYFPENTFLVSLTSEDSVTLSKKDGISAIGRVHTTGFDKSVFPGDSLHKWNRDNVGPFFIPKKDMTLRLNPENIDIYKYAIVDDGGNQVKVAQNRVYVNGVLTQQYRFKSNFYFMMGDNRHDSVDSRYWGFVPEARVVGKAIYKITHSGFFGFSIKRL